MQVEGHHQERAMMSEIYARGPITCSMAVPHILDWDYRGGVYIDHSNSTIKEIDHDVEVRLPPEITSACRGCLCFQHIEGR
jgi:hypothetical protein